MVILLALSGAIVGFRFPGEHWKTKQKAALEAISMENVRLITERQINKSTFFCSSSLETVLRFPSFFMGTDKIDNALSDGFRTWARCMYINISLLNLLCIKLCILSLSFSFHAFSMDYVGRNCNNCCQSQCWGDFYENFDRSSGIMGGSTQPITCRKRFLWRQIWSILSHGASVYQACQQGKCNLSQSQ